MTDAPSAADLARWAREHRPVPVIVGTKTHGGEAEYRDRCLRCHQPHPCLPSRLLALVAAQAEQITELRAANDNTPSAGRSAAHWCDRALDAEAAVTRVRAMADEYAAAEEPDRSVPLVPARWVTLELRRALDGPVR